VIHVIIIQDGWLHDIIKDLWRIWIYIELRPVYCRLLSALTHINTDESIMCVRVCVCVCNCKSLQMDLHSLILATCR